MLCLSIYFRLSAPILYFRYFIMFLVCVYMSVNNSPEYCLVSTINHTGRGWCQRYYPHLIVICELIIGAFLATLC